MQQKMNQDDARAQLERVANVFVTTGSLPLAPDRPQQSVLAANLVFMNGVPYSTGNFV